MRTHLLVLSVPLLCSTIVSQTIWNVPAGAAIQPVVDNAAPGDIVVLAPGAYEKFDLTKGLTVVGPATLGTTAQPLDLTIAIPPNQNARLVGLTIEPDTQPLGFTFGIARVTAGVVVFESCSFLAAGGSQSAITVTNADVVFDHCTIDGNGTMTLGPVALRAENANIIATDSTISGATGAGFQAPGRGVSAFGTGSLHLSSSTVIGGDAGGIIAEAPPQPAIVTSVPTWLTDCAITGGSNAAFFGADGLVATVATGVARCTITGGTGFPAGAPTSGPVTTNPSLLGARSSAPTTVGGALSLTYTADQAGVSVTVLATVADLISPLTNPVLAQPLWSSSLFVATTLTTAANAEATLVVNVPAVPAFQYQVFDFVGARLAGGEVQFAPVVPVTIR